jgi:hypothetical protein
MSTPETPNEAIEEAIVGGVKRTREDANGQEIESHSIRDMIAGANHLANTNAASKNHMGLRFTKLIPPGGG